MAESKQANVRTWSAPIEGTARNIFAIETDAGFVVVDAPLRKSDGAAARAWLRSLGKPVLAVLVTHAHPDHNFGLTQMLRGTDAPIYATPAVAGAIRATEEAMQAVVPAAFGEAETERDRLFPNAVADPSVPVVIDGVPFEVADHGAVESGADSVWTSPALPGAIFVGDLVMHRAHPSLVQGNSAGYLEASRRLRDLAAPGALFFAGHGGLVPVGAIQRHIDYIEAYRDNVRDLAHGRPALGEREKAELARRMLLAEPSPLLSFLIPMGADPVARELARDG